MLGYVKSPVAFLALICAAAWLYGYRHLLRYEQHWKARAETEEDGRRLLAGMRIFAASFVMILVLKRLA